MSMASPLDAGDNFRKTSFTDAAPSFPYQSSEATKQLGIPDSPEVHLAITHLADKLLLAVRDIECELWKKRITALRRASGAVLFGYSFERASLEVRQDLGLEANAEIWARVEKVNGCDWLGKAAEMLRDVGVAVDSRFRKQATFYGWTHVK
jgi:hypothetical protein